LVVRHRLQALLLGVAWVEPSVALVVGALRHHPAVLRLEHLRELQG
jgi:hypothetical protein